MHDTTPKKDIPRLATLDTLRGIAVLLVLGAHQPTLVGNTGAVLFCRAWQHIGWVGVDLFFVLSGFLVSGLLFRSWREHGRLNAGRFLMRRAWKIYPAFYAMLLIVIVNGHLHGRWPGWPPIVSEMLFIQNYTLMPIVAVYACRTRLVNNNFVHCGQNFYGSLLDSGHSTNEILCIFFIFGRH